MEVVKELVKRSGKVSLQPIVVIAGSDNAMRRHLEVTCRSLPESVPLKVMGVSNFAECQKLVSEGYVLLLLLDESLLSQEQLSHREFLFPHQPFLQTITWNEKEPMLSSTTLARSMKIAELTHEHLQKWKNARAGGVWH